MNLRISDACLKLPERKSPHSIFPRLVICHSGDLIKVEGYILRNKEILTQENEVNAKICVAFSTSSKIGFNLSNLKLFQNLFRFPQIFFHEILHFYFPSFRHTILIHNINRKTKGLLI